jgi:hypothetical protein
MWCASRPTFAGDVPERRERELADLRKSTKPKLASIRN